MYVQKEFYGHSSIILSPSLYVCVCVYIYIHIYKYIDAHFDVVTLSLMGVKIIPHFEWLCGLNCMLITKVTHS